MDPKRLEVSTPAGIKYVFYGW